MGVKKVRSVRPYSHVLLSAAFGIVAIVEALRLGRTYDSEAFITGPGGYMMVVGICLVIFALIGVVAGFIGQRSREKPASSNVEHDLAYTDRSRRWKVVWSFVFCVLYVLLIQWLGFAIATLLYLAGNLWLLQNPVRRIVMTCLIMLPILIFGLPLIGLSVPKGIFGI